MVGVAIVNYRCGGLIERQFERWSHFPFEIAVVDNDPESPGVASHGLSVRYIRLRGNVGFARAVNACWSQLASRYVLLLSADAEIDVDGIRAMASALEEDGSLGAVAPLHVDWRGAVTNPYHRLPDWLDLLSRWTHFYRFEWAKRRSRRYSCADLTDLAVGMPQFNVEQPPGSCLMVRRAAVSEAPMDERLPMFFNDVDLSRRLAGDNRDTKVLTDVVCHHVPGGSTRYLGIAARGELYVGAYRYVCKWQRRYAAELLRVGLIGELAVSGEDDARYAIRALIRNHSIFDNPTDDPVRPFWPTSI